MSERLDVIKHIHNQDEKVHEFDIDWLIEQAEENIKLRHALNEIRNVDEQDYQDDVIMIFDIADKALEENK